MTDMLPTIISGSVVGACSLFIAYLAKKISLSVGNLATKDFVTASLLSHGVVLKAEIGDMFVKSSNQQIVNTDIELRIRHIEQAFGIKLENRLKEFESRPGNFSSGG